MSSSLRRGALAAAAIAFSIASLAACAAGNNAQTLEIKPDNAATSVGDIKIQNAIVVTQLGTETKGPAVVSATIFNAASTDQTLDSVTVEGADTVELTRELGTPVRKKPEELYDNTFVINLEKSGFMKEIWGNENYKR